MKTKYIVALVCLCACCFTLPICNGFSARNDRHGSTNIDTCRNDTVILVKSLEQLKALPKGTVIETCDLSNQGFIELPDLRKHKIQKLDISGNQIWYKRGEHQIGYLFPATIEELNMSNCKLVKTAINRKGKKYITKEKAVFWLQDRYPNLKVIKVSNTNISLLRVSYNVERLEAANCGLKTLDISGMSKDSLHLKYLDISHNWNMHPGIGIEPERIDTLKCDSTARGERIEMGVWL